ncbi:MAG: bifunctional diaminohydroxyphosphoribosylaminopyrimidine deaminase/5-amino-6-(5-phosphoribosylamino)uracil reductase RibD [Candidatus Omnitrophota bacterium]
MNAADDDFFMRRALALALRGRGSTSPNPVVGAVIVKNGRIIAEGYHRRAGDDHAEIAALKQAGDRARRATLYVTLEPCDHYGRTPPCTRTLIKSGIIRVVIAMKDPNPLNNGRGVKRLARAGIPCVVGIREEEARRINEVFVKFITTSTPFVTVKAAQSLDGKIATRTGDSRWISSEVSRARVHEMRAQTDAIMVGAGTIIHDNPLLTSRIRTGRRLPATGSQPQHQQPIKVVVDKDLRISPKARIFSDASPAAVLIVTSPEASRRKMQALMSAKCEVLRFSLVKHGMIDLQKLMRELGSRQITSVLVEGGGEMIGSLVDNRLVDKFMIFIAPKVIGGRDAITSAEGHGAEMVASALALRNMRIRRSGADVLVEGYPACSPVL